MLVLELVARWSLNVCVVTVVNLAVNDGKKAVHKRNVFDSCFKTVEVTPLAGGLRSQ